MAFTLRNSREKGSKANGAFFMLSGITAPTADLPAGSSWFPYDTTGFSLPPQPLNPGVGEQDNMTGLAGHGLAHIQGHKKACHYCDLVGNKYPSGYTVKSYYHCTQCDVPLCRYGQSDCFIKFHELVQAHPEVDPKKLNKFMKAKLANTSMSFQIPL